MKMLHHLAKDDGYAALKRSAEGTKGRRLRGIRRKVHTQQQETTELN